MSDEFETETEIVTISPTETTGTPLTPSEAKDRKQMDDYQKKAEAERIEKAKRGEPTTD
jgi:hypothetical protein